MTVQASLCLTWLDAPKTVLSQRESNESGFENAIKNITFSEHTYFATSMMNE